MNSKIALSRLLKARFTARRGECLAMSRFFTSFHENAFPCTGPCFSPLFEPVLFTPTLMNFHLGRPGPSGVPQGRPVTPFDDLLGRPGEPQCSPEAPQSPLGPTWGRPGGALGTPQGFPEAPLSLLGMFQRRPRSLFQVAALLFESLDSPCAIPGTPEDPFWIPLAARWLKGTSWDSFWPHYKNPFRSTTAVHPHW